MKSIVGLLLVAPLLASGCYLKPTSSNNPLRTPEGVEVRLVGQDCEDHRGANGDPVSRELGLVLRVANPTPEPLRFRPAAVQLTVDGAAVTPLHGEVAYQIAAGEHRDLVLHFIHHATCDRDFVLRFDGSLTLGNRRLALAELTFVP